MRIAFLCKDTPAFETAFSVLAGRLANRGHSVAAFYSPGEPLPENRCVAGYLCNWWDFDFRMLEKFSPQVVVIFNGSFAWCNAATVAIKKRWQTYIAELAWLPQAYQLYLDPIGPGARSSLFKLPTEGKVDRDLLKDLRELYRVEPQTESGYILVPLQLEYDTSILYDSPLFKAMHNLIGFVRQSFPDYPIWVKPHPADPLDYSFEGVTIVSKEKKFNDLVPGARAVVGINSTTLIEALVHYKPVAALGLNVASNRGVFYEGKKAFENLRGVLDFTPDPAQIDNVLCFLKSKQFDAKNPPEWVLDMFRQEA